MGRPIAFETPIPKPEQVITAQMLDNGTVWLGRLLDDPLTVLRLQPDIAALADAGYKIGIVACYPQLAAGTPDFEVRILAPHLGSTRTRSLAA